MKHYITLLSLLMVTLGFAQKDPVAIIKDMNALKKQTITQMQANTDKTKNDVLYDKFKKEVEEKLFMIGDPESPSFKPYIKKDGRFTADFQKLLNNSGLEDAWNEGFAGFHFKQGYLAKTFRNYLSEEYLLYLKIDDIHPFEWDTFGEILLNECNFIKKYPNSRKIKEVKLCYVDDLMAFIFGVDNYSSFEYPESREIMKKFVRKNPQALVTPLIKLFLENTKINKLGIIEYKDPNKDTYELINTELEKQLGVKDISELSESYE